MYYTVDRIEGTLAVLEDEDGNVRTVPLTELPTVNEGDVLSHGDGGWQCAPDETERRRLQALRLQARLRKD